MYRATCLGWILLLTACSDPGQAPDKDLPRTQADTPVQNEAATPEAGVQPLKADLPKRGATLMQAIPALREKIAKGDPVASCQLAREFDFCVGAEGNAKYLSRMEAFRRAPKSAAEARTDTVATMTDLARIRGEYCTGVSSISPAERISLWRQAALNGHVSSMLQYGSGLAFGNNQALATLDELRVYKGEGPGFVQKVAKNGSFQANLMLARAYAPQLTAPNMTPLLRQAVTRNSATSLAYYRLAKELRSATTESAPSELALDTEMKALQWSMSPQDVAESEQEYRKLRGELNSGNKAVVDIEALNNADVNQPVPGMELCTDGGVLR